MAGTKEGGLKAAKTNREKYGDSYYANIGRKGGIRGHTGGFASSHELAVRAGRLGGLKSRRSGSPLQKKLEEVFSEFIKCELAKGSSVSEIARRIGTSYSTIKRFIDKKGWVVEKRLIEEKSY